MTSPMTTAAMAPVTFPAFMADNGYGSRGVFTPSATRVRVEGGYVFLEVFHAVTPVWSHDCWKVEFTFENGSTESFSVTYRNTDDVAKEGDLMRVVGKDIPDEGRVREAVSVNLWHV